MPTLTSTGNVNLTSSTNWSPAQTPAAGDDLIINGAHTLTLDADFNGAGSRLASISFNNSASKIAISGTSRTVECTNGWYVNTFMSGTVFSAAIASGTSVTLGGQWRQTGNFTFTIAASTGGNLTLRTIDSNQSSILFSQDGGVYAQGVLFTSSWTSGTLTTIGLISLAGNNSYTHVNMSGGTWLHQSVGSNTTPVGGGSIGRLSGSATLNWTGSVNSNATGSGVGVFQLTSSSIVHTIGQTGDTFNQSTSSATAATPMLLFSTGTCVIAGRWFGRNGGVAISMSSGTIRYQNQTITNPSTDHLVAMLTGGTLDLSGLNLTTAGNFIVLQNGTSLGIVVDSNTLITCTGSFKGAAYPPSALDAKIINPPSDVLTIPSVSAVAGGTVYGYASAPRTGTGLIVDPAILAAAVQAGVGLASPNLDEQLDGIATDIANITVDNTAIAEAVRTELTNELDIINNIPDSFETISNQIDDISTVVYVSPAAFTSPGKITGRTLRPYYKDTSRLGPIGIADSTKTPVDLSAFEGDLYVSVMDSDTLEVLLYDDDPYFVTSNLYIDPSPESVGVLDAPLCWALRRISDNKTLMEGPWEVQFAAYGT